MKKTLVLASLLAAFGAASAQSSVTLSGTTSFAYQTNSAAVEVKGITETDFTLNVSGKEALGNGMTASFGITLDAATNGFRAAAQRKDNMISLAGGFGSVTLANTRSSETAAMAFVAPTNLPDGFYDGSTSSKKVFARAAIDLLAYSYTAGPVRVGVSYSEAVTDGNANNQSKALTLSGGYTAGPLAIAAAVKNSSAANGGPAPLRKNNFEVAATYNLGFATVGLGFDSKPSTSGGGTLDTTKSALSAGVRIPFGAAAVGVNYAKRGDNSISEFGVQYNLSPRTNVNLSVGKHSDKGLTSNGQSRLSVNHAF